MYKQKNWQDHVTEFENRYRERVNPDGTVSHIPVEGEVIQEGTPQSASNFNNMENGIQDATVAAQILQFALLQQQRKRLEHEVRTDAEVLGETKTVHLCNTARWPFNSTMDNPTTVSLSTTRKNLYYSVEATVESHTGEVGEIHITDKALNGFKVSYDGPATSANIILRIKGGMA